MASNPKRGPDFYRRHRENVEQQRVTKFAPRIRCKGPHIKDEESVIRLIYFPDHISESGSLLPEAIACQDLQERGWSIFRTRYSSYSDIEIVKNGYLERKKDRQFSGTTSISADGIRKLRIDGLRGFVIHDSSDSPSLRGHAIVLCSTKYSKSKVKELRRQLILALSPIQPLSPDVLEYRFSRKGRQPAQRMLHNN